MVNNPPVVFGVHASNNDLNTRDTSEHGCHDDGLLLIITMGSDQRYKTHLTNHSNSYILVVFWAYDTPVNHKALPSGKL